MIDLRSDTVTRPTAQMRRAMAAADVGDDVYGEDPTVRALQERAAALFGREAALLCPSGVMCNQLWLRVLAAPGTEVVVEADSHVVNYEGGAGALLGGVQFRTLTSAHGQLDAAAVVEAIRGDHFPLTPTSLIWLEQTHNRRGGTYYRLDELHAVRDVCDSAGLPLYVDGARIFNAAVASGATPQDYGTVASGLMFSMSKSLGAPVGSVMVGDADAIAEARQWRRRYGGAMRQSGVLAAAGLIALDRVDRLAEDHANARLLAEAAAEVAAECVDLEHVQTNIVYVEDVDAPSVVEALAGHGVLAGAMDGRTVRMVTHPDVSAADATQAADVLRTVLPGVPRHA
ncbi:MAG: aminotransferase class I/II-fold pyridoxal phosphate-dependent enzyme [Nitriliruptorales bacterium]|nr:aminotransferase class I/II-fold pyridoxal phosphate-dependent enzyme [Nitriliruptorales bacterium]